MEIADSDSENETENTPTIPTPVIIPNDEPQANNSIEEETMSAPDWDAISMTPVGLGLSAQQQAKNMHPNIINPNILTSPTNSKRIPMARSHIISQESINLVTNNLYGYTSNRWLPDNFITTSPTAKPTNAYNVELDHYCAPVVHPVTGVTIIQYRTLANDWVTSDIWKEHAFGEKIGRMAQGDKISGTKGKIAFFHDARSDCTNEGKREETNVCTGGSGLLPPERRSK